MAETIGQRLKRLREAKGWSQRMLGARAQTSGSYINQLERGTLRRPGAEHLGRIATALGVSLDEIASKSEDGGRSGDDLDTASGDDTNPQQLEANRQLAAIQRELQIIGYLDPDELNMISRVLRLRRAKMERDRRKDKL